jgi:hypothetical protein
VSEAAHPAGQGADLFTAPLAAGTARDALMLEIEGGKGRSTCCSIWRGGKGGFATYLDP